MKIISLLNPKGGTGKTTATINIAAALVRQNHKIAVIDTDPQRSLTNWNKNSSLSFFDVFTAESEKDVYQVRKLNDYDFVLIDGAGSLSVITSAAVMVSDLVIIPISPSPLDFSATGSVIDVLDAQNYNRPVKAAFLVTRKINNTLMFDVLKNSIDETGIFRFTTTLSNRQTYVRSILDGNTVFESKDNQAIGEVEVLTNELLSFLNS